MLESKTEIKYKMYQLGLNPIMGRYEDGHLVAMGATPEELFNWMKSQLAKEPYMDGRYKKAFEKGSPIEMYNPLERASVEDCMNRPGAYHGIKEFWTTEKEFLDYIHMCRNSYGLYRVPEMLGEVEEFYNNLQEIV